MDLVPSQFIRGWFLSALRGPARTKVIQETSEMNYLIAWDWTGMAGASFCAAHLRKISGLPTPSPLPKAETKQLAISPAAQHRRSLPNVGSLLLPMFVSTNASGLGLPGDFMIRQERK